MKTYYFLLAQRSFRAREDSWQIELEHCAAVPSKTVKLSDDELQEIFRSGDQTRLMDTVKTWEIMAEQDTKTEPYLNLWFGILIWLQLPSVMESGHLLWEVQIVIIILCLLGQRCF